MINVYTIRFLALRIINRDKFIADSMTPNTYNLRLTYIIIHITLSEISIISSIRFLLRYNHTIFFSLIVYFRLCQSDSILPNGKHENSKVWTILIVNVHNTPWFPTERFFKPRLNDHSGRETRAWVVSFKFWLISAGRKSDSFDVWIVPILPLELRLLCCFRHLAFE